MKYLIILFLSLFLKEASAQGNLQFNQAKIISNTDPPQTVPAGKVWKIESVFSDAGADTYAVDGSGSTQSFFTICGAPSFYYHYYGRYLGINSIPLSFGIHSAGNQMTNLPIWVPAGSTICTCTSATFCARGYSVIEFNIVP
ncbi:MAG: hypothetical protein RL365_682 [Bacteroidota bacterium]|jgi:hypothetical protein